MLDREVFTRRRVLSGLAGGAAVSGMGGAAAVFGQTAPGRLPDPMVWAPRQIGKVISAPEEAIDVFDFETVAHSRVAPAHFGYMASGIDDEVSLRANRDAFQKFHLRPRRLVDVSKVDMSVALFGERYQSPIMLAPVGGLLAYHPDGEEGAARAARAGDHPMILSTMSSTAIERVAAARGRPLWFQLYPTNDLNVARQLVARAAKAGCTTLVVTVDRSGGRNQETFFRMRREDARPCSGCHGSPSGPGMPNGREEPIFEGVDPTGLASVQASALDWDKLRRIRDSTRMKCVVKGLLAAEDARLAADAGYEGIVVSNHGGRADEAGFAPIEALPGIVAAVKGRTTVLVDSGFRRGTDIVKALALGADGVAIGRPYLWGLGAFGQPGVERVLELLRTELRAAMQQIGAPTVAAITSAMVQRA